MKTSRSIMPLSVIVLMSTVFLHAHFQTLIPSLAICEDPALSTITLDLAFCHPFEGDLMNMQTPVQFGVVIQGTTRVDLLSSLTEKKQEGYSTWNTSYSLNTPGDHVFFVEPAPYWEPVEGCYIIHYTKVVVNAYGMEKGWDTEVGCKTEIIPLTRPYGLYTGNVFQGMVYVNGTPAPFCEVEVEYYNNKGTYSAPAGPFITQVIKTDVQGVFSYVMPVAGWWGFAALNENETLMRNPEDGKDYPIEIGALIWIYVQDMK